MNKSKRFRSLFRTLELMMFSMIALDCYHNALFWSVFGLCIIIDIIIDLKEKEEVK